MSKVGERSKAKNVSAATRSEATQQQREHMRRNKPREKLNQFEEEEEETNKRQAKGRTMWKSKRPKVVNVEMSPLLAVLVLASLLTCLFALTKAEAAVVRPTIFKSDPNPPESAQAFQQQQQQLLQQQQQLQLQQQQLLQQTSNSQANPISGKQLLPFTLLLQLSNRQKNSS